MPLANQERIWCLVGLVTRCRCLKIYNKKRDDMVIQIIPVGITLLTILTILLILVIVIVIVIVRRQVASSANSQRSGRFSYEGIACIFEHINCIP